MNKYPKKIPVFPLSNFIVFPNTTVPLNIFDFYKTGKTIRTASLYQVKKPIYKNYLHLLVISKLAIYKML